MKLKNNLVVQVWKWIRKDCYDCILTCIQDTSGKGASTPIDVKTYQKFITFIVQKQNAIFGVILQNHCSYLNGEFAAKTLIFGGPRGSTELTNLSIKDFVTLETNLVYFLQSGITQTNQTGGDSNFTVKVKPDLYFLGEELVHHLAIFQKRARNADGSFVNERLFLRPLPSATF